MYDFARKAVDKTLLNLYQRSTNMLSINGFKFLKYNLRNEKVQENKFIVYNQNILANNSSET